MSQTWSQSPGCTYCSPFRPEWSSEVGPRVILNAWVTWMVKTVFLPHLHLRLKVQEKHVKIYYKVKNRMVIQHGEWKSQLRLEDSPEEWHSSRKHEEGYPWVPSLVGEDPICYRTSKPMCHSYWEHCAVCCRYWSSCTLEPMPVLHNKSSNKDPVQQ